MIPTYNAPIDKKDIWNPLFYKDFLGYESIATWWNQYEHQFQERWPVVDDYNAWFQQAAQLNTLPTDAHFSFILQTEQSCYEQDIFKYRTIPSRMQNWHDFFNNITWILYPKTKWAIIQRTHQESTNKKPGVVRTMRQNLLAHFDECGMILCSHNPALFEDVKAHAWKKFFFETTGLIKQAWPLIFGHGLFEKAQKPYIGMTGKTIFLKVEKEFFDWSMNERLQFIDTHIAQWILSDDFPNEPKALYPFPMLGWPKWHLQNDQMGFYENEHYFRPLSTNSASVEKTGLLK